MSPDLPGHASPPPRSESRGTLRLAVPADGPALYRLFGAVPMEGELVLSTRRDPDFFALYAMQRGEAECWVYDARAGLGAMGAILVREGWLAGEPRRVGYLGDLRLGFAGSRDRTVARFYGDLLAEVSRRHGCELFLTAVLASNAAALNALVRRRGDRASQPHYHLLRRFAMVSIQFAGRRRPERGRIAVRDAALGDLPEMVALLDRDHRARPFGYRYDQGELEHRLAHWPGMSLERTYVACDPSGRIVGVASAWDPAAVKRYRVIAYRGGMLWTKRAFNVAARVLGYPRLPDPGQDFRYLYLTNTSIEGDDPEILRALVARIYADLYGCGYHFFSICLYENDPLGPALRGFHTRRLDFHLYLVTLPGGSAPAPLPGRPGFEMALA